MRISPRRLIMVISLGLLSMWGGGGGGWWVSFGRVNLHTEEPQPTSRFLPARGLSLSSLEKSKEREREEEIILALRSETRTRVDNLFYLRVAGRSRMIWLGLAHWLTCHRPFSPLSPPYYVLLFAQIIRIDSSCVAESIERLLVARMIICLRH